MSVDFNDVRSSRQPDDQDQNFGWVIKRAGTDSSLKLIILSSDVLGIRVHFFRGRTGPCVKVGCEACRLKQLSRWKGYLLAFEPATSQQLIFEFTPPGSVVLETAKEKYGTMRGLQIIANRASKKPNAKVQLAVLGCTTLGPSACPDYAIWPILARIWGLMHDTSSGISLGSTNDLSEFEELT